MGVKILLAGLVLGGLVLAVRAKVSNNRWRVEQAAAVDSPMTEAIAQLLGIAGGIYLSLVMALSFLGMEQPEAVWIGTMAMDPLAMLSVVLACLQPIVLHCLRKRF